MIFQSLDFVVFLLAVFALHWLIPQRWRNLLLVIASYFFYGYIHPWFMYLLGFVTLVVYACGVAMERLPRQRRAFAILGVGACLGMLGAFKYFHFFTDNIIAAAHVMGLDLTGPAFHIVLPVGISFFAFQGMSYVIDVYRGDIRARSSLIDVALFKAFFPQLVAGPIERSTHFLPQIERPRQLDAALIIEGVFLIIWGYFKKLVIADNVSIIANKVFLLEHPGFPLLWAGVLAFCVQIFADFSGYTDIARGTAKLFGIQLVENFRNPYLAISPVDFWRRWHISLSSWFRDYVYVPLGGNRGGRLLGARNIMITFILSGLWHGASWNYVLWGAYWGALIVLYNSARDLIPAAAMRARAWLPVRILGMFILTNIGWLLFRETNFHYLARYLTLSPWAATSLEWEAGVYLASLVGLYATPLVIHIYVEERAAGARAGRSAQLRPLLLQTAVAAVLFAGILLLRTAASGDFIYFQF